MPAPRITLPPLDERQRYSIAELIAYLRSSRKTVYTQIAAGQISTFKVGRRRYVSGAEIARLSREPTDSKAA